MCFYLGFPTVFQLLHLFAYLVPMPLPRCSCFISPVYILPSTYMLVYSFPPYHIYIFQTMSSYISFFKLTVPVFGLFHDLVFSVPFDALSNVNIITVLVHYNHLYLNGYFHGILLDFHVYYTLI